MQFTPHPPAPCYCHRSCLGPRETGKGGRGCLPPRRQRAKSPRGLSTGLEAVPEDGVGWEDWDLRGCVETESRAGPGGTERLQISGLGWKSGSGWGSPLRTACLAVL